MSDQDSSRVVSILVGGAAALVASLLVARIARMLGGRWPRIVNSVATLVALLIWMGFFMPSLHGPTLLDVVLLAAIAPILNLGTPGGLERSAFFLAAAAVQTIVLVLDLATWRYGMHFGDGIWLGLAALLLLGPAVAAGIVHAASRRRLLGAAT